MKINEFAKSVHELAVEKGWYQGTPRTPLETHALIHSEVSEATECVRNGEPAIHHGNISVYGAPTYAIEPDDSFGTPKPCGEAVELADAIIRIADYFVANGWDLEATLALKHEFNKGREWRHGGKLK